MNTIKAQWILGNKTHLPAPRFCAGLHEPELVCSGASLIDRIHTRSIRYQHPTTGNFHAEPVGVGDFGFAPARRWERLGALLTMLIMPIRELVYILVYREWTINFLLIWALVIPPAVMYLLAWYLDRKQQGVLYNISFGESGGPVSTGICGIAIKPDHVRLYFTHGAFIPDRSQLSLKGSGKAMRYPPLTSLNSTMGGNSLADQGPRGF